MFKPTSAKDRINYGEALIPPVGYRVERAIGTTYSLDLETLTAVVVSLGLLEDTDSELIHNPISMLSALQKISDRIVVFCEAGQIKMPAKPNVLCLVLEKIVVPIALGYDKRINRYPAFHPKTWLLEYVNDNGEKKYRFIVMSRNMTFDHSWDIACSLEGDKACEGEVSAQPIVAFLTFLQKQLNKDLLHYDRQKADLEYLIQAVSGIGFKVENGFSECEILPLGIGNESYNMAADSLFTENFHELIVMSPFLTGSVIESLNDDKKTLTRTKRTLITRRAELPKIAGEKASNFEVYVMKDDVIDGESAISEEDAEAEKEQAGLEEKDEFETVNKQYIHAKIFLKRKYGTTDLYLGSMNASYAAMNSNVEMMLRLRTTYGTLNGEKFLDDIMGNPRDGKKNPYVLVNPEFVKEETDVSIQDNLEKLIKEVSRLKMKATVRQNDEKYDICISVDIDHDLDGVKIRPLRSKKESEIMQEISFVSLDLLQLSEFYVVSASQEDCTLERVIMIPTSGMPEGREDEIIRDTVKTNKHFMEYVSFILGDDYVQSFLENKKASDMDGESNQIRTMPAVYEKMLKTSVTDPNRLAEIQYLTNAIDREDIIPAEFREMYAVFCETLGIKKV